MCFFRRILRVSYVDRVTNQEVLERAGIGKQLLQIIDRRQLRFLGHIEELSLSGKINERVPGAEKAFSQELQPWVEPSAQQIRMAKNSSPNARAVMTLTTTTIFHFLPDSSC